MGGCSPAVAPTEPAPDSGSRGEISPAPCRLYREDARDPNLLGTPRTAPPRCCQSDFGLDPELVGQRCGFREYLGESEEFGCVHRFRAGDGETHELRLHPIVGLDFDAATALLESGSHGRAHVAASLPGRPRAWLSSEADHHWLLADGWPVPRRLHWSEHSCSREAMAPVLEAFVQAPAPTDAPGFAALPRLELGAPINAIPAGSLLARARERAPAAGPYTLPHHGIEVVHEAMRAVALDDADAFAATVTASARWGLPDRRQLGARPIQADEGASVRAGLRQAAARFDASAELHCPAIDRRVQPRVRRGEALMWCLWAGPEQLDLMVFGLRGFIEGEQADGRIEYIGLFPEAPRRPLPAPGEPPPPPVRPTPAIHCGDPHAVDYPGLCPEPEPEPDQSGTQATISVRNTMSSSGVSIRPRG